MSIFSYRGVVLLLGGFLVAASLLAWPNSQFAAWYHRATPLLGPLVLLLVLLVARWRGESWYDTAEPDGSELFKEPTRMGVAAVIKKPRHPERLRAVVEPTGIPRLGASSESKDRDRGADL